MSEYTHDDRLNDIGRLSPRGKAFNDPKICAAYSRLYRWLAEQKAAQLNENKPEPNICQNCMFLCWNDQTCVNAESPGRLTPQDNPVSCGLWVPITRRPWQ